MSPCPFSLYYQWCSVKRTEMLTWLLGSLLQGRSRPPPAPPAARGTFKTPSPLC